MHEREAERVMIQEKDVQQFRNRVDAATKSRVVISLDEDTFTESDGTVVHRAVIVRSKKNYLTE